MSACASIHQTEDTKSAKQIIELSGHSATLNGETVESFDYIFATLPAFGNTVPNWTTMPHGKMS